MSEDAGRDDVSESDPTFGRYRIERLLARGGMGEVYLASWRGELGFEQRLVIKTIRPELAADERFVQMFGAEARTAVSLSHGNIVPVYECGRVGDTFYLAMAYVDGASLEDILAACRKRGAPLSTPCTLFVARQILRGLAYAHEPEPERPAVVHRDLSPRNVLVSRSGQVLVTDFGIAVPAQTTVEGTMGSLGYMAPEQASGKPALPSADVFSVGTLLFELLTLRRAFPKKGVYGPLDLRDLPEGLAPTIERCLSLAPEGRFLDAGSLLDALRPLCDAYPDTYAEREMARELAALVFSLDSVQTAAPQENTSSTRPTFATAVTDAIETFATRLHATTGPPAVATGVQQVVPLPAASGLPENVGKEPVAPRPAPDRVRWIAGAFVVALAGAAALLWGVVSAPGVAPGDDASPKPVATTQERPPSPSGTGSRSPGPTTTTSPARPFTEPRPRVAEADVREPLSPLVVRVDPPDARLRLNDAVVEGRSPYALPRPRDGVLHLIAEKEGYVSRSQNVRSDEPREILLRLKRAGSGFIDVFVDAPNIPWAEVTIDAQTHLTTPLRRHPLTVGRHRVQIRCPAEVCGTGRELLTRSIEIAADTTTVVRFSPDAASPGRSPQGPPGPVPPAEPALAPPGAESQLLPSSTR